MDFIFYISIIFIIIGMYYYLTNERIYCDTSDECPDNMYCKIKSKSIIKKELGLKKKLGRCYKKIFV
jgi:hypothetical protein